MNAPVGSVREALAEAVLATMRRHLLDTDVPIEKRRSIVRGGLAALEAEHIDMYSMLVLGVALVALAVDEVLARPWSAERLAEALGTNEQAP